MIKMRILLGIAIFASLILFGCKNIEEGNTDEMTGETKIKLAKNLETVTLAGGCFWCVESDFEKVEGVSDVISGYMGGEKVNPTYSEVSSGKTKYLESVQLKFDPEKITYEEVLNIFWRHMDPTDEEGQFIDRGPQYRSAIFYHNEMQRLVAEKSRKKLNESGIFEKPVVTEIKKASIFYKAEEYHQDYYKKSPIRYKLYRINSGRDQFLTKTWNQENINKISEKEYKKPEIEELRKILTDLQYRVTQEDATERAFDNEYHDNKEDGIYVDIVSGEPLYSSTDKYDSKTGWPSFTKPLVPENIVEREDRKLFSIRTEIRSKLADSHLGHIFDDGPEPTGLRYCMNSAALKFIPKENLEKEGYSEFKYLFED